jgi:hypothetical protein
MVVIKAFGIAVYWIIIIEINAFDIDSLILKSQSLVALAADSFWRIFF